MRRAAELVLSLLSAALFLATGREYARADEFKRLTGRAITERIAGREFTDETHWAYTFRRDGTLTSVTLGKPGRGSWGVQNDELCTTAGPGTVPCHEVWIAGPRLQLRRPDGAGYPEEGLLK